MTADPRDTSEPFAKSFLKQDLRISTRHLPPRHQIWYQVEDTLAWIRDANLATRRIIPDRVDSVYLNRIYAKDTAAEHLITDVDELAA